MKKVIKLTERDLNRIVKRTLKEQVFISGDVRKLPSCLDLMRSVAKKDLKSKSERGKIGAVGKASEDITIKLTVGPSPQSGVLVAFKDGKQWCKCS